MLFNAVFSCQKIPKDASNSLQDWLLHTNCKIFHNHKKMCRSTVARLSKCMSYALEKRLQWISDISHQAIYGITLYQMTKF